MKTRKELFECDACNCHGFTLTAMKAHNKTAEHIKLTYDKMYVPKPGAREKNLICEQCGLPTEAKDGLCDDPCVSGQPGPDAYKGLGGLDVVALKIILRRTFHDKAVTDIVRAVNVHEDLLEAAKWALSTLTDVDDEIQNHTDKATVRLLIKAIARAEGK